MKYQLFIASYSYVVTDEVGTEYVAVPTVGDDGSGEVICESPAEATKLVEAGQAIQWYSRPKVQRNSELHTADEPFDSYAKAVSWLADRSESIDGVGNRSAFRSLVRTIVIDTNQMQEFKPVYEVELEVTMKKTITVRIDSDEHDGIEDEWDARAKAVSLCDEGDYDEEIEYAEIDRMEIDDMYCEVLDS
jgi:hypothetical protein